MSADVHSSGRASAVVLLAILAPGVNVFITATILPTVVAEIGGLALYAWVTIAYSVTSIVGSAASSAAARALGLRAALGLAAFVFMAGTVVCAMAPSMAVIVIGRAIQGAGGGMIIGIDHALVRAIFPPHRWSRMLATISAAWGISALTGPAVGGLLAAAGLWRAGFWAALVVAALPLALGWDLLPARRRSDGERPRIPLVRLGLLCGAVLSLALISNQGGWLARAALIALAAVAVERALAFDRRASHRLFPSNMLSLQEPIGRCFWMIFLIAMSVSPIGMYLSLFLQVIHEASPAVAGYVFAGHSLAWTVASIVTTHVPADRVRFAMAGGPVVLAAGLAALAVTIASGPTTAVVAAIVLEGSGIGLCWAHIANRVLEVARKGEEEATASLIPTTQLFAVAFGGALAAIVAAAVGLTRDATPPVAAAAGQALYGLFAVLPLGAGVIAWRQLGAPRHAARASES
jgi:predicted MFS family arabinose efflux permease